MKLLLFLLNKTVIELFISGSLFVFCPLAFAHNGEMFGVIIGVLVLLVYILFALFILAVVCKKWNKTNKLLEELSKDGHTD